MLDLAEDELETMRRPISGRLEPQKTLEQAASSTEEREDKAENPSYGRPRHLSCTTGSG